MAISRMQEPRQNYGLGSFVKKLTRKVTKPFTKVARKIVPKEIAGIMRIAAPFVGGPAGSLMYLAGTAKQKGRISPMDLALTAAPYIGSRTLPKTGRLSKFVPEGLRGQTISQAIGGIEVPFTDKFSKIKGNQNKTLREVLLGYNKLGEQVYDAKSDSFIFPNEEVSGFFGRGGKMASISGDTPGILDTKVGRSLFGKPIMEGDKPTGEFGYSPLKLASLGLTEVSRQQGKKLQEEMQAANAEPVQDLVNVGEDALDSETYRQYLARLDALTPELFAVPQRFQLAAANGGLMRTNYAMGSDEEPKPLPEDPTKPVNPFQPKPIGPFPSKMASVDEPFFRREYLDENAQEMFNKPYKDLTPDELEEFREEMERLKNKFSKSEDTMMAGIPKDLDMETAIQTFRMVFERDPESIDELLEFFKNRSLSQGSRDKVMLAKKGGLMRENFALGTRPTEQESGLGGLPIEADMRYTGGFMPYGAKEKADDVPARLSKNEFVFTADAVRAAGGGSVNEGARKMYQAMKQLEAKPEAKGMMA